MPPKRKRVEESSGDAVPTSSRSTRASARIQAQDNAAAATDNTAASTSSEPSTKRKKASTTAKAPAPPKEKKKPAPKKSATKKTGVPADEDPKPDTVKKVTAASKKNSSVPNPVAPQPNGSQQSLSGPNGDASSSSTTASTQQAPPRPVTPPVPTVPQLAQPPAELKVQPYTAQRSLALFQKYADSDDPNVIGPEGFESLCTEGGIPLEGALPLILAWQMNAKEMAKISKEEWAQGTEKLKIASLPALAAVLNDLQNMLIMQQGVVAAKKTGNKKDQDIYDKTVYTAYGQDTKAAFGKLYTYCFGMAKPEGSRNIDMETSCAFWSVLLGPQYPIVKDILEFINEKGTYKATNKDLWSMMLEFCQTVNPSLQDYEADGAWPTLLDDFVSWQKVRLGLPEGMSAAGAEE